MEENVKIEQYTPKEKLWAWMPANSEEIVEGYRLPVDEDGDFNPNIYEVMVAKCQSGLFEIKDCRPDYFELVAIPEPTEDEIIAQKQESVRRIRNQYLEETDKYMILDYPISDDERLSYKNYREYLRDYTLIENWWQQEPNTFEEWSNNLK